MKSTLELGRIAGVSIGINWSWLIIFGLITWSLADVVFPDQNPGLSTGAYWGMALIAALLFFIALLLHELGHAIQARRDGVEIEGITLWLFGGVAKFRGTFPSAGAEFRIAIAGPVVSALLAIGLIALALSLSLPAGVDGVAFWLGYINAILLVFNLLPAPPLDGGRLLHAALWHVRRDLVWATHIGASVGRAFGHLLIGAGILILLFGNVITGAWLIFLGWFLGQAASAEEHDVVARQALKGVTVADLMAREPITVRADATLGEFMDQVARRTRYTTYPVEAHGRVLGLLPFRRVAAIPRTEWDDRRVFDCMLQRDEVPTFTQDEPAADALGLLSESQLNRGLVFEDDQLVGLLSVSDLARAIEVDGRGRPSELHTTPSKFAE